MKNSLSKRKLERYSRQIILKDIGILGQKKIINSKVLIVGIGGLGSPVADLLARCGVGYIGAIDHDKVDISNLQRQILYTSKDVGKFKVISQSSIASGVRRVEALRDKQLEKHENHLKQNKSLQEKNLNEEIKTIKKELQFLKITPDYRDQLNLSENLKNLSKQLSLVRIENIKKDKSKNIISL